MFRNISFILFCLIVVNSNLDYGEFDAVVTDYVLCRGPKRKSCVTQTVNILDNSSIRYNLTIIESTGIVKGKISSTLKNQELLRLQIKDLCDQIFIRPLIQRIFSLQDRCGFVKGNYVFNVDLGAMAHKFYGSKFMYGNWTTRFNLYTDYCNVHCGALQMQFTPKK